MREITIGTRTINDDAPAYVIAELGHNHGGSVPTAIQMIKMAAGCGASAVKLQKRDNKTLYSKALLNAPYEHEHSFGKTYGEHREALEFGLQPYISCRAVAQACKVDFFATAFDEASADFLMDVDVPAIKIHSGGLTDEPLLKHVAGLGVPIILSTGGGDETDIDRAVQALAAKTGSFALLHCTASYPLRADQANLRAILTLRNRYPDTVIGFSSHSPGIAFSLVAYAFGARIFEHHVTLSRAGKGADHGFSLEPKGLQTLVEDLGKCREALGDGVKKFYPSELAPIMKMRRWYVNGKWQIGTQAEQEPRIHA